MEKGKVVHSSDIYYLLYTMIQFIVAKLLSLGFMVVPVHLLLDVTLHS